MPSGALTGTAETVLNTLTLNAVGAPATSSDERDMHDYYTINNGLTHTKQEWHELIVTSTGGANGDYDSSRVEDTWTTTYDPTETRNGTHRSDSGSQKTKQNPIEVQRITSPKTLTATFAGSPTDPVKVDKSTITIVDESINQGATWENWSTETATAHTRNVVAIQNNAWVVVSGKDWTSDDTVYPSSGLFDETHDWTCTIRDVVPAQYSLYVNLGEKWRQAGWSSTVGSNTRSFSRDTRRIEGRWVALTMSPANETSAKFDLSGDPLSSATLGQDVYTAPFSLGDKMVILADYAAWQAAESFAGHPPEVPAHTPEVADYPPLF